MNFNFTSPFLTFSEPCFNFTLFVFAYFEFIIHCWLFATLISNLFSAPLLYFTLFAYSEIYLLSTADFLQPWFLIWICFLQPCSNFSFLHILKFILSFCSLFIPNFDSKTYSLFIRNLAFTQNLFTISNPEFCLTAHLALTEFQIVWFIYSKVGFSNLKSDPIFSDVFYLFQHYLIQLALNLGNYSFIIPKLVDDNHNMFNIVSLKPFVVFLL